MVAPAPGAAVFLDRDGTLMDDSGYPSDPGHVRLVPHVAPVLAELELWGVPRILVTNQSGIARGMLTEEDYARVHARLVELLAAAGASLTAEYHCPHHPDFSGDCDCRKPSTAMFLRAAAEHSLDPGASLFVGDRWRDVAPGIELGGMALLVPSPGTPPDETHRAAAEGRVAASLADAVTRWRGTIRDRGPGSGARFAGGAQ